MVETGFYLHTSVQCSHILYGELIFRNFQEVQEVNTAVDTKIFFLARDNVVSRLLTLSGLLKQAAQATRSP
jgi:hypothetical protein